MKKSILFLAVMATLLCLSSCKKEENGKVLFMATIENPTQQNKTSIASDGMMTWRSGDQISMFYSAVAGDMNGVSLLSTTSTGRTADFTLMQGNEPTGGHYYAIYPTRIAGLYYNTINLPASQEYHAAEGGKVQFEAPMYAYSNNDQLAFKNLCSVVRITLTVPKTINRIVVSANEPLCGEFTVSWNGGEPTLVATSTEGTEVEFTCGSGVSCTDGADFYIYLPVNETGYTGMEFVFYATDGTYCSKTLKSDQIYVVGRNTLNPLVFSNLTFRPVGSKGGLFSVSAMKQVWFSQGNLQYQASTNTWHFAEHQYDYIGTQTASIHGNPGGNVRGSDNRNISSTYSGWIDLFGWGTSGWNSGANCYQPWSTSTSPIDYHPGGSSTSSLTGAYAEADWVWHNAINNGGNAAHKWRTLTRAEWDYLLNTRANASSKHGIGNINGVGGLIILPDSWSQPSGCSFTSGLASSYNDWTRNSYTIAQWAQMEAAGAVFLPAAGLRSSTSVNYVNRSGFYWSSTPSYEDFAYSMSFYSSNLFATYGHYRNCGFSLRPVQD